MSDSPPKDLSREPRPGLVQRASTRRGLSWLILITVLFSLIAIAGIGLFISRKSASDLLTTPPPSLDELAQQFPQLSNILQDDKLDSVYKQFMVAYQEGGPEAAYELAKKRGILNADNEVRMTLELDTTESSSLQESLKEHGIKVTAVSGKLIDVAIPVNVLEESFKSDEPGAVFMDISGLDHIIRIRLPQPANEDVGSVETEGAAVIGADVWNAAGITGRGIKIGVLDVGFDGYKELLGSDLPANVVAQSFIAGMEIDQTGSVHGAAVSEIIHDIAPDAELIFADYQTVAEKQAAVDWLMSQSVDIITSSTSTTFGRRDGKSFVSQMVDQVFSQGVLWVNSAGNTGYTHYRGEFTDQDGDGYHEFDRGDEFLGFSPSGPASLSLVWDDWDRATQDFDMYILDEDGNEVASSTDTQSGEGSDAGEFIYYEFSDEGPYYMAIFASKYDRDVTFDFFLRDGQIEYYTPEFSLNTPADAEGSLTVGAVYWETSSLEDYSSRGPTDDGRVKPEIVAPSGVSSAAYGETWDGTSASCPHVTGAAALVLQAFPNSSPQQVRDFLLSRAVDLESKGPDPDTGYGALNLGDPPDLTQIEPVPTPIEPAPAPEPTPTDQVFIEPTAAPQPTETPVLESNPGEDEADASTLVVTLILLGCVILPGIIAFAGLGLLGAVVYMRRSQPKPQPPHYDRRDWGAADQIERAPIQPHYDAEEKPVKTVVCSQCGKENRQGTHFCTSCGTDLRMEGSASATDAIFCTNCGNPLRPNSKFCPKCGHLVKKI